MFFFMKTFLISLLLFLINTNAHADFYDRDSSSATSPYRVGSLLSLSKLEDLPEMYAGTIDNDNFWLFREKHNLKNDLIVWFGIEEAINGMGPFTTDSKGFRHNEETWLKDADLLFVDLDIQTYFSNTDHDFWNNFFNPFLSSFSFYKNRKIYLAGEGIMGGQLVPMIANSFLKDAVKMDGMLINNNFKDVNLQGIVVQDGNFDPVSQSKFLIQFGNENSLLNTQTASQFSDYLSGCGNNINCFILASDMLLNITRPTSSSCYNRFNYNDNSQSFPDCGLSKNTTTYLFFQDQDILSNLHFQTNVRYIASGDNAEQLVSSIISAEYSPLSQYLATILKMIPIFFYNSDEDISVNYMGARDIANSLGGDSFLSKSFTSLKLQDNFIAQFKSENSLALVEVPQSSKWINCDASSLARALIHSFIFIENFREVSDSGTIYFIVQDLATKVVHPDFITILSIGIAGVYIILGYAIYKKLFIDAEPIFTSSEKKMNNEQIKAVNLGYASDKKTNPFEDSNEIVENTNICEGVEGVGEADFVRNNKTVDVNASIEKMKMKYVKSIPYNNYNIPKRSNTTTSSCPRTNIVKLNSNRIVQPSRQGSNYYQGNSYVSVYQSDYAPSTLIDSNDSILQEIVSFPDSNPKDSNLVKLENPFNNTIPTVDDHYAEDIKFSEFTGSISEKTPLQSDFCEDHADSDNVYDNRHSLKEYLQRNTVIK